MVAHATAPRACGFFLPARVGETGSQAIGQRPMPTAADCPRSLVFLEVVAHPQGGYSHAEPVDATRTTRRIYRGWWSTRRAARSALTTKFS